MINDQVYEVRDGDLFLVNQFEAHKVTFQENMEIERYVIQIHPDFLFSSSSDETDLSRCFYQRPPAFSHKLHLTQPDLDKILLLLQTFGQTFQIGDDLIKTSAAVILLAFVNQLFSRSQPNPENIPSQADPLQNAILYINSHFSEELTLEQIAKNCYISVNQLCRIFKDTLGTTVMKYVIGKRISEAKKYLKAGYNVSDAALMCGFRDYSHFIRTFTASAGISPGKYAKM